MGEAKLSALPILRNVSPLTERLNHQAVQVKAMVEIEASIIIPTKNGATHLEKVLEMIFTQVFQQPFEVVVLDSGSTDSTLDIVKRYPVRLIEIRPDDFGHGKTRNLGADVA